MCIRDRPYAVALRIGLNAAGAAYTWLCDKVLERIHSAVQAKNASVVEDVYKRQGVKSGVYVSHDNSANSENKGFVTVDYVRYSR